MWCGGRVFRRGERLLWAGERACVGMDGGTTRRTAELRETDGRHILRFERSGRGAQSSSTSTGAWSLAPLPLRSSRSMEAPVTRAARAGEARAKSIRMPCFLGKRSWV